MKIIDLDKLKDNNGFFINIIINNSCLEEIKELWGIGEEYPMSKDNKESIGLKDNDKLIINKIYELKNKPCIEARIK